MKIDPYPTGNEIRHGGGGPMGRGMLYIAVLFVAAACGGQEAAPVLAQEKALAGTASADVAAGAVSPSEVEVLLKKPQEGGRPYVEGGTSDPDIQLRQHEGIAVVISLGDRALPALVGMLESEDAVLRRRAAFSLAEIGSRAPEVLAGLRGASRKSGSVLATRSAMRAYARLDPDHRSVGKFLMAIANGSVMVGGVHEASIRGFALEAIASRPEAAIIELEDLKGLLGMLVGKETSVERSQVGIVIAACEALAVLGEGAREAVPLVVMAFEKTSEVAIGASLRKIDYAEFLRVAFEALSDTRSEDRRVAGLRLLLPATDAPGEIRARLLGLETSGLREPRLVVAHLLGSLPEGRVGDEVVERLLLGDSDALVRAAAVAACTVRRFVSDETRVLIWALRSDPDPNVVSAVREYMELPELVSWHSRRGEALGGGR